jgi:hypothetical protein
VAEALPFRDLVPSAAAEAAGILLASGQARAVTDGAEIRRLAALTVPSWVTWENDHFISISPTIVNGRRVSSQRLTGSISAHHF